MAPATTATYARDVRYWTRYDSTLRGLQRAAVQAVEERWRWRELSVHIDRLPAPDAPIKLILVHGVGGYGRLVLAPFGLPAHEHGVEVVAPDLPGYGITPAPKAGFDLPLWVDCLTDLVEAEHARDGRPVVLFGLSLGGTIAFHAATRTDAVAGLVVTTLLDPRRPGVMAAISRWPRLTQLGLPLLRHLRLLDRLRLPVRLLTSVHAIANDAALSRLCLRDPQGGGSRLPLRFVRTITTSPAIEPQDFTRCDVLALHPTEDRWTDIAFTRDVVDDLPRGRLVELEGCGHFPVEEPGISTLHRELRDHLDRLEATLDVAERPAG
jgi:pimeloyl-ACP methyl ester carboxylesterase